MREARLDQVLKKFPAGLPLPEAVWLIGRTAEALADRPRPIKPSMVRVKPDGGIRIMDRGEVPFGFRSPEELDGKGPNVRSAVFSVGSVLVQVLTGRAPFVRESDFETRIAVSQDEVPPLVGRVRQATKELDAILRRALAKHPADRIGSLVELARQLDGFLEENLLEVGPDDVRTALGDLLVARRDPRMASEAPPAPPVDRPVRKAKTPLPEIGKHDFGAASLELPKVGEAPNRPAPKALELPELVDEAHVIDTAKLDIKPEAPRLSAPHKPKLEQDLVRVGDPLDGSAGAGITEASVTGVRASGPALQTPRQPPAQPTPQPAWDGDAFDEMDDFDDPPSYQPPYQPPPARPQRPLASDLLSIDERALDQERTKAGTMAPTDSMNAPPPPNWILRITLALIGLVALAAVYQFVVRPFLVAQ